jgi:hypothetical protein
VEVPDFLLRKLYKRGSLRETGDGRFAFTMQNPLANASLVAPPRVVVNGVAYPADKVAARRIDLAGITPQSPFLFRRGDQVTLNFEGHLLRGGNRIHIQVVTKEFGSLDIHVEDREAEFCDVPGMTPRTSEPKGLDPGPAAPET